MANSYSGILVMETIKLFTFITISLIPIIVSSTKCEDQEAQCIELCCKVTQYYDDNSKKCKTVPSSSRISWQTILDGNTLSKNLYNAIDFVVADECEASDDTIAVIPFCYSLYNQIAMQQFGVRKFFDVPCDRLKEPSHSEAKIFASFYVGTIFVCLFIMVIYACVKGLKERFIFKLYSWYLVSMAVTALLVLMNAARPKLPVKLLDEFEVVGAFAFMSTWLWLNVIGFQMWSGYKNANAQDDPHANKRRFIWYSIYVWGISAITSYNYIVNYHFEVDLRFYLKGGWMEDVMVIYSLTTYLVLSVNICITRCRVANLTTETHAKLRLASVILRLGLMMGFPRMVVIGWMTLFDIGQIALIVLFTLEPFVMFIVLLWKPTKIVNWILISCGCKNSTEISNTQDA